MYIGDQTWSGLENLGPVAVVPVGSTEQHGPHLPLATDYLIAEGLAREATKRTGHVCTPTVNIGVSPHHKQFTGTLWVEAPEFRAYMENLSRNLTYHGIDRIVYVNAHGGNVEPLREVGRRLHDDHTAFAVEWMWNESIPDLVDELFSQNGPHGGPKETAMIMHLAPDLVREDQLEAARDDGILDIDDIERPFGTRIHYDSIDNSPNGVFGDQTDVTPEKGETLFEAATDQLVGLLEWLETRPLEDLLPKPHV